jgi:uncharacterized membrane protein
VEEQGLLSFWDASLAVCSPVLVSLVPQVAQFGGGDDIIVSLVTQVALIRWSLLRTRPC